MLFAVALEKFIFFLFVSDFTLIHRMWCYWFWKSEYEFQENYSSPPRAKCTKLFAARFLFVGFLSGRIMTSELKKRKKIKKKWSPDMRTGKWNKACCQIRARNVWICFLLRHHFALCFRLVACCFFFCFFFYFSVLICFFGIAPDMFGFVISKRIKNWKWNNAEIKEVIK